MRISYKTLGEIHLPVMIRMLRRRVGTKCFYAMMQPLLPDPPPPEPPSALVSMGVEGSGSG